MQSLLYKEERNLRIKKKLKSIEELYNLAFLTNGKLSVRMKTYKDGLVLSPTEKDLTSTAKQLASKIKELNKSLDTQILADRLTQVHKQIIMVIKEEFTTIRNRHKSISTITTK